MSEVTREELEAEFRETTALRDRLDDLTNNVRSLQSEAQRLDTHLVELGHARVRIVALERRLARLGEEIATGGNRIHSTGASFAVDKPDVADLCRVVGDTFTLLAAALAEDAQP